MDGDLLKSKRRSKHSPDGLRPHGEPDGLIPAPIDRDDTGPHSLKHHTGNLLRPDPSQARLPTSERVGELLRCDRAKADDAAHATVLAEPDLHLYAVPPPAWPPSMVDHIACGDAPGRELLRSEGGGKLHGVKLARVGGEDGACEAAGITSSAGWAGWVWWLVAATSSHP
jgi:hypothetical protein